MNRKVLQGYDNTYTHTHTHTPHPHAQHQGGCVLICVVAHFSCTLLREKVVLAPHHIIYPFRASVLEVSKGKYMKRTWQSSQAQERFFYTGSGCVALVGVKTSFPLWSNSEMFKCVMLMWRWTTAHTLFVCLWLKNARNVIILNDIQSIHPNRISSIRRDIRIDFFICSFLNFLQNINCTKLTGFCTDSISECQNRNLYSAQSSQQVCEFTFWRLSSLQETSPVQSYAIVCVALNSPHSAGRESRVHETTELIVLFLQVST